MTDAETLALRCRQDPRWSAGEITRRGTPEYAASLLMAPFLVSPQCQYPPYHMRPRIERLLADECKNNSR